MQGGGSCSVTQTTTTRGPIVACTSAGVGGQCADTPGSQAPVTPGSHQPAMLVPKSAVRNSPDTAAVTVRASGAVSAVGFDPAEAATVAACSTAETSADVWTAQSPASSAPMRQ